MGATVQASNLGELFDSFYPFILHYQILIVVLPKLDVTHFFLHISASVKLRCVLQSLLARGQSRYSCHYLNMLIKTCKINRYHIFLRSFVSAM